MRLWIAVSALLIAGASSCQGQRKLRPRYRLPVRAQVVVQSPYNDIPATASDHSACDGLHTSPQQIRRLFASNLEIDGMERHSGLNMEFACGIAGHILLDGRSYDWRLLGDDPPGVIETNYPDGQNHILAHRLSDLSDNPKPHRISRYVDKDWPQ